MVIRSGRKKPYLPTVKDQIIPFELPEHFDGLSLSEDMEISATMLSLKIW